MDHQGRGMKSVYLWIAGVVVIVGAAVWMIFLRGPDRELINFADTSVEIVDGTVVSACFTFDMPTLVQYELNPNSRECQTSIRWADGDSLTEIVVAVQKGDNDLDAFFALAQEIADTVEGSPFSSEVITISGVKAGVVYMENSYGIPVAFYQIPLPTGAFELDGLPITSVFVSGPTGSPDLETVLDELVASLTIPD